MPLAFADGGIGLPVITVARLGAVGALGATGAVDALAAAGAAGALGATSDVGALGLSAEAVCEAGAKVDAGRATAVACVPGVSSSVTACLAVLSAVAIRVVGAEVEAICEGAETGSASITIRYGLYSVKTL